MITAKIVTPITPAMAIPAIEGLDKPVGAFGTGGLGWEATGCPIVCCES